MLNYDRLYKVKTRDDLGSATFWNDRLKDLDLRLNDAEGQYAKFDAAAQQIIDAGISRINTTFQPLLDGLIQQVNELAVQVGTLQATVLTDQNSITVQLNATLASANALLAQLQSLGTIDGGTF